MTWWLVPAAVTALGSLCCIGLATYAVVCDNVDRLGRVASWFAVGLMALYVLVGFAYAALVAI